MTSCIRQDFRYDSTFAMKFSFQRERSAVLPDAPKRAEFPPLSGADIAGLINGQNAGGDFYHFLRANRCRVVFGLLDVAGKHEENHAIVEAARQTFQDLGKDRFAPEDVNEADVMMEFCLELKQIGRASCRERVYGTV